MAYLPLLLLALVAGLAGWLAYRQWGARGAIAVAVGAVTALAAFWPRKRAPVAPPPTIKLDGVRTAGMVMIERHEDKEIAAIRTSDAAELARKMSGE